MIDNFNKITHTIHLAVYNIYLVIINYDSCMFHFIFVEQH